LATGLLAPGLLADASMTVTSRVDGAATWFDVRVQEMQGPTFLLVGSVLPGEPADPFAAVPIGIGILDPAGGGQVVAGAKTAMLATLPKNTRLHLWAFYLSDFGVAKTGGGSLLLNAACERVEADYAVGGIQLVAGTPVDEQWGSIGLHVLAQNSVVGHPDMAIIFDSANPTGDDPDLATPGYGPGNDTALGKLVVIAENDADADLDGLVDDPDDEEKGGVLSIESDMPVTFCGICLVDVDEIGTELRFFAGPTLIQTIPIAKGDDNNVQDIGFTVDGVTRLEVAFAGSGGVAHVDYVPCRSVVAFDESTTGIPLGLPAGTELSTQLASLGIEVSAVNNVAGHPDRAILFNTAAPTGDDTDLATPGYGPGNDVAQRLVLILAENDADADLDGLVDDPDDEEKGGVITLRYGYDVTVESATVLDVDTNETSFFELYDAADALVATVPLAALGDNSSQTVTPGVSGVRRVELHLGGSGALAALETCPYGAPIP
jgi:hypothetical protein